jgi:hypothetical protein
MEIVMLRIHPYKFWQVVCIVPVVTALPTLIVSLALFDEVFGGSYPLEFVWVLRASFCIGVFLFVFTIFKSKNLYWDVLSKKLFFTRPYLLGFAKHKKILGTPIATRVHAKRVKLRTEEGFADGTTLVYYLQIFCESKGTSPSFIVKCHNEDDAYKLAANVLKHTGAPFESSGDS